MWKWGAGAAAGAGHESRSRWGLEAPDKPPRAAAQTARPTHQLLRNKGGAPLTLHTHSLTHNTYTYTDTAASPRPPASRPRHQQFSARFSPTPTHVRYGALLQYVARVLLQTLAPLSTWQGRSRSIPQATILSLAAAPLFVREPACLLLTAYCGCVASSFS